MNSSADSRLSLATRLIVAVAYLPGRRNLSDGFFNVLRPVDIKGFIILPKRWIVERTFAFGSLDTVDTARTTKRPPRQAKP